MAVRESSTKPIPPNIISQWPGMLGNDDLPVKIPPDPAGPTRKRGPVQQPKDSWAGMHV